MNNKESIISEVLIKCQQIGQTVIVGGYIRNKLIGFDFKDVDILTTCSPQQLKQLFPQLNWTEQGLELGITRMGYKGISFEFSSCLEEEYQEKLIKRDFTVNAFIFDGTNLIAQYTGSEDIKNKLLRPTSTYKEQMINFSPQSFIRPLRFISLYGFHWTDELTAILRENAPTFRTIPDGRLQSEAYEILKGEYVLKSFFYYETIGLLTPNKKLAETQNMIVPLYNQNLSARVIYLSYVLGEQTVIEWLEMHHLSHKLIEDIREYLPYLKTDQLKIHPKKLPFMTLVKRYQFNDDKGKIREFIMNSR